MRVSNFSFSWIFLSQVWHLKKKILRKLNSPTSQEMLALPRFTLIRQSAVLELTAAETNGVFCGTRDRVMGDTDTEKMC